MLNIYFGDMPEAVYNTSVYFNYTYEDEWLTSDFAKEVIKKIDKSNVLGPHAIESPVLGVIPPENLSGGTKTLLLMANDPEKAAYYEKKIDDFFEATPQLSASFAAKGLVYEPGGVVVHEDGSVTYIGGCSDSPERVAEVNAINKAKREKEAAQRKASLEHSQEAAEQQRQIVEHHYQKQMLTEALQKQLSDTSNLYIVNQPQVMTPAVAAYENAISTFSKSVIENI